MASCERSFARPPRPFGSASDSTPPNASSTFGSTVAAAPNRAVSTVGLMPLSWSLVPPPTLVASPSIMDRRLVVPVPPAAAARMLGSMPVSAAPRLLTVSGVIWNWARVAAGMPVSRASSARSPPPSWARKSGLEAKALISFWAVPARSWLLVAATPVRVELPLVVRTPEPLMVVDVWIEAPWDRVARATSWALLAVEQADANKLATVKVATTLTLSRPLEPTLLLHPQRTGPRPWGNAQLPNGMDSGDPAQGAPVGNRAPTRTEPVLRTGLRAASAGPGTGPP